MVNYFFKETPIRLWQEPMHSATALAGVNLQEDLSKVFGKNCQMSTQASAELILMEFEQIQKDSDKWQALCVNELLDEQGNPRWEAYLIQEYNGQIFIIGSDVRGLIYGIYDFSQQIGVSPWHFFADVPEKKQKKFKVAKGYRKLDYPSVQYRGIFINDEEELNHWAQKYTTDGTIGPQTYKRVFDLLLRLKANYIWPAMHVNYFNQDPKNGLLASEMGIIVGTSHCDMLLRSNQHEWEPWLASKGYLPGEIEYDYSISGKNREVLQEYWSGSVEMNKDYEVSYTVGMRGIHDSGFITREIDENNELTNLQKEAEKKVLLEQIIKDQRQLLQQVLNKKADDLLQTFVPYKEVLAYYDDGLEVPDDITIIWANDNYGNIRRYPNLNERKRSGGHGLYYHSSYWAPRNMHYLFINSTPLAKMKNEFQKAWNNGIRKMWVLNVGAIKPIEQDIEFFTRFSWEVGKETTTKEILGFLASWINRDFSGGIGAQTAELLNQFTQIVNVRKIEMLDPNTFSQVAYGDEAGRRLNRLREMFDESNRLAEMLPVEEKEAFFQIVQMKIHAAYFKNAEFYFADRSCLAYEQGKMQAADRYREASDEFTEMMRWMIHYYNKIMCSGKWNQMLTPELAPPPNMKMYPPTKPALTIGSAELGVVCWQAEVLTETLVFEQNTQQVKWFEVFNKGAGEISYQIEAPDWLELSQYAGRVSGEERILVYLSDEELVVRKTGNIVITSGKQTIVIPVFYKPRTSDIIEKVAFERDGVVSIALENYSEMRKSEGEIGWQLRQEQGRYEGAAIEASAPELTALSMSHLSHHPQISYEFTLNQSGSFLLELYRQPSLNAIGEIRLGVQFDDESFHILSSTVTDEHRGNWERAILDDTDKLYLKMPYLQAGNHRMTLFMIDSYVCLTKAVIYTQTFIQTSLGPLTYDKCYQTKNEKLPVFASEQQAICEEIYQCPQEKIELPLILFADDSFYSQDFIGADLIRKEQTQLGIKRYQSRHNGTKDLVADYLSNHPLIEKNGQLAIEAEQVLAQDSNAYTTSAKTALRTGNWEHIGAPSNGGTGLAMVVKNHADNNWENVTDAPGLHFNLMIDNPGNYAVWLLLKYSTRGHDKIALAVDGQLYDQRSYISQRGLFSYLSLSIWHWNQLTSRNFNRGNHVLSLYGISTEVAIDRIFLTKNGDFPPLDAKW